MSMKKFEYIYKGLKPLDNLTTLVNIDDMLYFDIETTGLSKIKNHIYLIGIGYYSDEGLNIIQWFAENESEEPLILKEFIDFSDSFTNIVNYNGKTFDIPFTNERMNKYGLTMPNLSSTDIYLYVKPLKSTLSLDDLTQKTIERFLNIKREDKFNGGELISVYKKYVASNGTMKNALSLLLLHNKEDVLNMHYLTRILDYNKILDTKCDYSSYEIKAYSDYNGESKKEMILYGTHDFLTLPKSINNFVNLECGRFIMNYTDSGKVLIRVPIIVKELYFYFENYKDYYYLPLEDMCVLKSVASAVSKENRVNATKENCRVKLLDSFIPISLDTLRITDLKIKTFKSEVKSKSHYIRLSDFEALTNTDKSILLQAYIFLIWNKKGPK